MGGRKRGREGQRDGEGERRTWEDTCLSTINSVRGQKKERREITFYLEVSGTLKFNLSL